MPPFSDDPWMFITATYKYNSLGEISSLACLAWLVKVQATWDDALSQIKTIYLKDSSCLCSVSRGKSLCDPQYATLSMASEAFHATYNCN